MTQDLPTPENSPTDVESTVYLLSRVREGEPGAPDRLVRRFLPSLMRWAHGRLPRGARDVMDTQDLVQVTFIKALDHLDSFESRWRGAFFGYLRRILMNQIRDEIRKVDRRPTKETLDDAPPDETRSPLEEAVGSDVLEAYEKALQDLPEEHQQAIFMRVELGFTYQEIADALEKPTMNAARMLTSRAMLRLAEALHAQGIRPEN